VGDLRTLSVREQFSGGRASATLKRGAAVDTKKRSGLKIAVADLSMSNELLREKIHRM